MEVEILITIIPPFVCIPLDVPSAFKYNIEFTNFSTEADC